MEKHTKGEKISYKGKFSQRRYAENHFFEKQIFRYVLGECVDEISGLHFCLVRGREARKYGHNITKTHY